MSCIIPVMSIQGRYFDRIVKDSDFAVLPLGSIEYHGPHAPLGTDSILAEGFGNMLEGVKAVLYPTVYYSACPGKTAHYPGTIPVAPEPYTGYLSDIVRGICRSGFHNILMLNAHDGNMGISRIVAEKVTAEFDASILIVNWWQLVPVETTSQWGVFSGTGRGHGGPYEMSAVKAFCPDAVTVKPGDADLATPGSLSVLPYTLVESRPQGWQGYTGNIHEISKDTGERIVREAINHLASMVQKWLSYRDKANNQIGGYHE